MRIRGRAVAALAALVAASVLTACGGDSSAADGSSPAGNSATDPISVVASTNVWGDVAAQIGGDQVAVTPLITDPAADPHSFEPTAQAQLALSKAALVLANGGGYDDYLQQMLEVSNADVPVVDAVQLSGRQPVNGELNEHVWYDLPTAAKVAERIAAELSSIRPGQATLFRANLADFTSGIDGLTARTEAIKAAHAGTPIAVTEPVPLYLTEAAGLVNRTPDAFSAGIENGTDVPPGVLADTVALLTGSQVAALVVNEQTSSPETEQLVAAATDNSIAVVGVTETLPAGLHYLTWMDENVAALSVAVGG